MKRFTVWNRETDERWTVALPEVNTCVEAEEQIAEKFNQNWLDLGSIRTDNGEDVCCQQSLKQ